MSALIVIKTVCAWCQGLMVAGPPAPVSHGMCIVCQARLEAEILAGR